MVSVSNLPWVEKYRPESLDDLISQKEIVSCSLLYSQYIILGITLLRRHYIWAQRSQALASAAYVSYGTPSLERRAKH